MPDAPRDPNRTALLVVWVTACVVLTALTNDVQNRVIIIVVVSAVVGSVVVVQRRRDRS
jgi:hypothetical protein